MAKTKAATIRGVALAPGVSRNGNLYTRENIGRAVQRAQARIAAGEMVMLTHHGAEDDSTHIVGRVTGMAQNTAGQATFEADLAPTANGKVIKTLVTGAKPFLRGVSIRGRWQGKVRSVNVNGQPAETADDLELLGLDFTHRPGVPDAKILAESAGGKAAGVIYEEVQQTTVTKSSAKLAEKAQRAFYAEAFALRAISEAELSGRMAASLAARRSVTETGTPAAVPVPETADLARLSQEDFEAVADSYWASRLAGPEPPRSPFWRGLDGPPAA